MAKKLSPAQQKVVDVLKENEGSYIFTTTYYNFQEVRDINGKYIIFFNRPTFEALEKRCLIHKIDTKKHVLVNNDKAVNP